MAPKRAESKVRLGLPRSARSFGFSLLSISNYGGRRAGKRSGLDVSKDPANRISQLASQLMLHLD